MLDNENPISPSHNNEQQSSSYDYLMQADRACAAGDLVLGMHLYLAAFENLSSQTADPAAVDAAFASLNQAWNLAIQLRERTIAEYVFERLSVLVTPEEADQLAMQLQDLAFDKLQEFGLTPDDLQGVTNMIAQEARASMDAEMQAALANAMEAVQEILEQEADSGHEAPSPSTMDRPSMPIGPNPGMPSPDGREPSFVGNGPVAPHPIIKSVTPIAVNIPVPGKGQQVGPGQTSAGPATKRIKSLDYSDLVGFDSVIPAMRKQGIGMQQDEEFKKLVELLNSRHGVEDVPTSETLVFSSPAREDAMRFMEATYGEIGLPAIRMRMDEGPQGVPVLCVMMQQDRQPRLNATKTAFEGEGVLILEDVDLWTPASYEPTHPADDLSGLLMASMSRGARDAVNLIRSAIEQPNVHVLASMSSVSELDPFIMGMLEPLTLVQIELPNQQEREAIWQDIFTTHPSMRGLDKAELVRYSAGMPRYDIYMAAREAVSQAYRDSIAARGYIPVTSANMYEKLALYHPLDSSEYKQLEDCAVRAMSVDFEKLEKYMNGEATE